MVSYRNNWFEQLLKQPRLTDLAFPALAVASFLVFIIGAMSYFGSMRQGQLAITSNASEGARVKAIQELIQRGETTYQYKTDQTPPPMASQ